MALHRFAVGQSIEFLPDRFDATDTRGAYTITRLHPNDARDGHERVVRESQIRLGPHHAVFG